MGHGLRKVPWLERYWRERIEDLEQHRSVLKNAGWADIRGGRKFIGALSQMINLYRSLYRKQRNMLQRESRKQERPRKASH